MESGGIYAGKGWEKMPKKETNNTILQALGIGRKKKPKRSEKPTGGSYGMQTFEQDVMQKWQKHKDIPRNRVRLYQEYDLMEDISPEIGTFLDLVSAEATQPNHARNELVWASAKQEKVRKRVHDLLHRRLRVNDWARSTCRSLAKYGDDPCEVLYDNEGVQGVFWGIALADFMRFEDGAGNLLGFALMTRKRQRLTRGKYQRRARHDWLFYQKNRAAT